MAPLAPKSKGGPAQSPRGTGRAVAPPQAPPLLLSIGGREGIGQRINGDYELLDGVEPGGRPCWLRCSQRQGACTDDDSAELVHAAGESDSGPLYLFFNDMGYWTIAPSPHAVGVQVLARSGPDFSIFTPDAATAPWVVFANSKGRPDPGVVCFRHDASHQPPEALHLTGCRGAYGQLNGLYYRILGVAVGSRPIFVKNGLDRAAEEEHKLLHFSQRIGRWLLSSVVPQKQSSKVATMEWSEAVVLAKSPVAWTSMSPVHLLPREPWLVRRELPERLLGPRRSSHGNAMAASSSLAPGASPSFLSSASAAKFGPFRDLRVATWTGGVYPPQEPTAFGDCPASPVTSSGGSDCGLCTAAPEREHAGIGSSAKSSRLSLICIHLQSPQGLSDPYALNGDYYQTSDVYGERPVYAKHPPGNSQHRSGFSPTTTCHGRENGSLYLFFDDISGRWQLAPEIGAVAAAVARSSVGWDVPHPPVGGLWQLRVPSAVAQIGMQLGLGMQQGIGFGNNQLASALNFKDWGDLCVNAGVRSAPCRTVIFGGISASQSLDAGHALAGDFGLLRDLYGRRPVYRRAPKSRGTANGMAAPLYLFFEPRSGYWVVCTGSPFAAGSTPAAEHLPDFFGKVVARSGPAWEPFTPEAAAAWEIFDLKELGNKDLLERGGHLPECHLSHVLTRAPWLRLHALGLRDVPKRLYMSGFPARTQMVNGVYDLLPEARWSTRPAWQRVSPLTQSAPTGGAVSEYHKYLFFWPETGHWVIGPELHNAQSALARTGPGRWMAESPDRCPGRWSTLNGKGFGEDPQISCRRERASVASPDHSCVLSEARCHCTGTSDTKVKLDDVVLDSRAGDTSACKDSIHQLRSRRKTAPAAFASKQPLTTSPRTNEVSSVSDLKAISAVSTGCSTISVDMVQRQVHTAGQDVPSWPNLLPTCEGESASGVTSVRLAPGRAGSPTAAGKIGKSRHASPTNRPASPRRATSPMRWKP